MLILLWFVRYLFLVNGSQTLPLLQNNSYLHSRSPVLFAFKICFDQIFVVSLTVIGGFNKRYTKSFLYVVAIMISK